MTSASSAFSDAAQVTVTSFIPATARTFVTGSAQTRTAVGDGDADIEPFTDALIELDGVAVSSVLMVEVGDADAGGLSFADDPAGTGVAGADDELASAGDDGIGGDDPAVTSVLELVCAGNEVKEPTRGATDGSASSGDEAFSSVLAVTFAVVVGATLVGDLEERLEMGLDVGLGVRFAIALTDNDGESEAPTDGDGVADDVVVSLVDAVAETEAFADGDASRFTSHNGGSWMSSSVVLLSSTASELPSGIGTAHAGVELVRAVSATTTAEAEAMAR